MGKSKVPNRAQRVATLPTGAEGAGKTLGRPNKPTAR
jgi:hypothetical protein